MALQRYGKNKGCPHYCTHKYMHKKFPLTFVSHVHIFVVYCERYKICMETEENMVSLKTNCTHNNFSSIFCSFSQFLYLSFSRSVCVCVCDIMLCIFNVYISDATRCSIPNFLYNWTLDSPIIFGDFHAKMYVQATI